MILLNVYCYKQRLSYLFDIPNHSVQGICWAKFLKDVRTRRRSRFCIFLSIKTLLINVFFPFAGVAQHCRTLTVLYNSSSLGMVRKW